MCDILTLATLVQGVFVVDNLAAWRVNIRAKNAFTLNSRLSDAVDTNFYDVSTIEEPRASGECNV